MDLIVVFCILFVFMLVLYCFCVATEFSVNKRFIYNRGLMVRGWWCSYRAYMGDELRACVVSITASFVRSCDSARDFLLRKSMPRPANTSGARVVRRAAGGQERGSGIPVR